MRPGGWILLLGLVVFASARTVAAGEADVMHVEVRCTAMRTCDFDVKVRHADVGFSHYADRYEILAPNGEVLGTRVLRHPHVHEQPFVRSLVGVEIPDGVSEVTVRAHDSVHGLGGAALTVQLVFPASSPPSSSAPADPPDSGPAAAFAPPSAGAPSSVPASSGGRGTKGG